MFKQSELNVICLAYNMLCYAFVRQRARMQVKHTLIDEFRDYVSTIGFLVIWGDNFPQAYKWETCKYAPVHIII